MRSTIYPFLLLFLLAFFNGCSSEPIKEKDSLSSAKENLYKNLKEYQTLEKVDNSLSSRKNRFWVNSTRLKRRTCPSQNCGVVGEYFYRESVDVFEIKGPWVRVTKYYDAACENGISRYVDEGNNQCNDKNGISNGLFSEWVEKKHLLKVRPEDPAKGALPKYDLIKNSDDFGQYKNSFLQASEKLILEGRCSEDDFKENGGWTKSMSHKNEPVYFIYCGGTHRSNRVYLNAQTGEIN